jgi:Trp operon repressor
MLEKGVTQRAIATALGVSLCKITRGSHELKYGPPGFRNAIRRAIGGRTARATTKLKGLKG